MIGTFFLLNDTKVRHFHAAWQILWVIAGSTNATFIRGLCWWLPCSRRT